MTRCDRERLVVPSEWDIVLAPELAPLFVLDAAIVAARGVLSIGLDPSSSTRGGTNHPPTRDLLDAMRALRVRIRDYRLTEVIAAEGRDNDDDGHSHGDKADLG